MDEASMIMMMKRTPARAGVLADRYSPLRLRPLLLPPRLELEELERREEFFLLAELFPRLELEELERREELPLLAPLRELSFRAICMNLFCVIDLSPGYRGTIHARDEMNVMRAPFSIKN